LAGIIGANMDGVGMVGVAPDADLAIAKITTNSAFSMSLAKQALQWGQKIDADVANISGNVRYDRTFMRNWHVLEDGTYYNSDRRYQNRYYGGENPYQWRKAMGDDMIVVNSAGNSALPFPEMPGTLATATDANGNLILDGRMLIVGAYDLNTQNIAGYSNKAGHICKAVTDGGCADTYRISDFYILAPGNMFTTDERGSNYTIQTGTSQAAAVVSGAVAVVKQMWPHLEGKQVAKILLDTANKDIRGSDVDVHGQGLLDLEAATRPIGEVTMPTADGGQVALSGGFMTNTSDGLADLAGLSSVMVTDEYGRNYYVDMAQASNAKSRRMDWNPITKAMFYDNFNPYNSLNYWSQNVALPTQYFGNYDLKLNMNEDMGTAMFDMGFTNGFSGMKGTKYRLGFGMMNEQNAWMGNSIGGSFGQVSESYTQFTNFTGTHNFTDQVSVFGSMWLGYTSANLAHKGLVTEVSPTQSYSWNLGLDYTKENHSVGLTMSQPVTVYKGDVNVALPVALTANGAPVFENHKVGISPDVNEYDFGTYYKFNEGTTKFIGYAEYQMNYLNQADVDNTVAGFSLQMEF
jgi:hypothetical protein